MALKIKRFDNNPLIVPGMDARIGGNINGPSIIRVPDWVENPLGRYYLYFAHHEGAFIRMAYADEVTGPYTVYTPGVLDLERTVFLEHIASPDAHIDDENHVIYMYYHGEGVKHQRDSYHRQWTCYAESKEGLYFETNTVCLGPAYMKVFAWAGAYYSFSGRAARKFHRGGDRKGIFKEEKVLHIEGETFTNMLGVNMRDPEAVIYRMRHAGVHLRGDMLDIYYSNVGDNPERIKRTSVDLKSDWSKWQGSAPVEILKSEMDYEGLNEPMILSKGGTAYVPVHQVRDPALLEDDGRLYLLYSVAGEFGLAGAELIEDPHPGTFSKLS